MHTIYEPIYPPICSIENVITNGGDYDTVIYLMSTFHESLSPSRHRHKRVTLSLIRPEHTRDISVPFSTTAKEVKNQPSPYPPNLKAGRQKSEKKDSRKTRRHIRPHIHEPVRLRLS